MNADLMARLAACPFCGDEAELTRGKDKEWGESWRKQWVACCKGNIDADCFGVQEPTYFSAAFARSMWNRRTHHAELEAMARDAERLDWLAESLGYISVNGASPDEYAHATSTIMDDWRNAIDAAMQSARDSHD